MAVPVGGWRADVLETATTENRRTHATRPIRLITFLG
jgi:hypothetical protein